MIGPNSNLLQCFQSVSEGSHYSTIKERFFHTQIQVEFLLVRNLGHGTGLAYVGQNVRSAACLAKAYVTCVLPRLKRHRPTEVPLSPNCRSGSGNY